MLLQDLPISFRLVNELHERLLEEVRERTKRPGRLRDVQDRIGRPGSSIRDARFVPPPPARLRDLLYDWERFVNEPGGMPPGVRCTTGIVTRVGNTWPHLYVAQRLLDEIERPIASGQD